jgi:hypothetical protein
MIKIPVFTRNNKCLNQKKTTLEFFNSNCSTTLYMPLLAAIQTEYAAQENTDLYHVF